MSENGVAEVTHYDLPERRLELVGATLSRRLEHGKGIWRLELPRDDDEPLVVEQLGGPVTPPADVARVLPAFLRGANPERLDGASTNGRVESSDDSIGRLRSMLERQYAQILRHDPGVRLDLDPEDVHRLRVAVRRSRAILRAARPVLDPSWSEPLRDELHWLGSALGRRRDIDVLVRHLQREIEQLEQPERTAAGTLVELLAAERETAQAIALDALTSERYYWLLDGLESAARGPRVQRGEVSLRKLAAKEFERLRKVADRLGPDATDEELHRARILGKRARYTAELAEPEVGKPARKFVEQAKAFQDVLGAHQDAIVAEARLRGLLADSPGSGAAFAAGRLVERERRRRPRLAPSCPRPGTSSSARPRTPGHDRLPRPPRAGGPPRDLGRRRRQAAAARRARAATGRGARSAARRARLRPDPLEPVRPLHAVGRAAGRGRAWTSRRSTHSPREPARRPRSSSSAASTRRLSPASTAIWRRCYWARTLKKGATAVLDVSDDGVEVLERLDPPA